MNFPFDNQLLTKLPKMKKPLSWGFLLFEVFPKADSQILHIDPFLGILFLVNYFNFFPAVTF
jgi:hypothetical protein